MKRIIVGLLAGAGVLFGVLMMGVTPAAAAPGPTTSTTTVAAPSLLRAAFAAPSLLRAAFAAPTPPTPPKAPTKPGDSAGTGTVTVNVPGATTKPSSTIMILIAMTVLSVAPALLLMCTSFTKIFVVLSITRNALGLSTVPPNQVLAGLALFLSLFIMSPVLSDINKQGVQPYLHGLKTQTVAFKDGVKPLQKFMVAHTRKDEIALFTKVSDSPRPASAEDVPLTTLVPAFVLSELRAAFIIGFVVYIPFLVIDMVVSASLMSLGMMMLPPVTVSLPFKLLLFVLVNGWGLVVTALVGSY